MDIKKHAHRKPAIIGKNRLEAFSDGVIAIIITLMILEIKLPHIEKNASSTEIWNALLGMIPNLVAYVLSFVALGIYWVNHHYFFHHIKMVDTKLLWHNLHLLFWLSLIPLPTTFIAEHYKQPEATAAYGFVMFMCAMAYSMMNNYAVRTKAFSEDGQQDNEQARKALRLNWVTLTLYFISIFAGYVNVYISIGIFALISAAYFMPSTIDEEWLSNR